MSFGLILCEYFKQNNNKDIFNIKFLLNTKILIEKPHKKRHGPPQCYNCQSYGHTQTIATMNLSVVITIPQTCAPKTVKDLPNVSFAIINKLLTLKNVQFTKLPSKKQSQEISTSTPRLNLIEATKYQNLQRENKITDILSNDISNLH